MIILFYFFYKTLLPGYVIVVRRQNNNSGLAPRDVVWKKDYRTSVTVNNIDISG